MKKIIVLAMTLALSISCLAGCGEKQPVEDVTQMEETTEVETETTEAETPEVEVETEETDAVTGETVTEAETTKLENVVESITYSIEGVQYTFPTPVSDWVANGWMITDAHKETYPVLTAGEVVMIEIRNANMGHLSCVQIKNMTDGDIALDEGVVVGMHVDALGAPDFNLLGDINFQSTRSDLDAKCTGNDLGFGTEYMCAETKDETAQVLCFYDMEMTEPTMFVFEHIGADGELDESCFDF